MPFSSIHFSWKLSQSISDLFHFDSNQLQLFSMQLILSFSFSSFSPLLTLWSRSSCSSSSICLILLARKAVSSSLFSTRVASAAFFLVKISSLSLSSLFSLSSFLIVFLRVEMISSFLLLVPNMRFFLISLNSRFSMSFSSRRIWFSFSMFFRGLWYISARALLTLMLELSWISLLLWAPGERQFYSFLLGGETLDWMRFLRVARMGTKWLEPSRDSLMLGELAGLLYGERVSYLLGEIIRCPRISFCYFLLGFVVIQEDLQLLGYSELIDSSSVVWICLPGNGRSLSQSSASGYVLIFLSVFSSEGWAFLLRNPGAVLLLASCSFL